MKRLLTKIIALLFLIQSSALMAQEQLNRDIRILGRKQITVTTPHVRLSDLANVSSSSMGKDEIVIGLKKIYIIKSPAPGKKLTMSAAQALEKLREEGVDLTQIGYAFPRVMTISRASRGISREEIAAVIETELNKFDQEATVKGIEYSSIAQVAPGILTLSAQQFHHSDPGKIGFQITAQVEGEPDVRFNVIAQVNQWVEVPVARRPLLRGSIVGAGDVAMARLNVVNLPADSARNSKSIVGLETSHSIGYGEVFQKKNLLIPPIIEVGAKVTMIYRSKLFKATASGVALEAGIMGQSIRIKNDSSKKVLVGKVVDAGTVEVSP